MSVRMVTFSNRDSEQFVAELKAKVAQFFEATGRSQKANARMVLKTIILVSALVVPWTILMTVALPKLVMLGIAVGMGLVIAGIGFAVSHDALHGAYSHSPKVNAAIGLSFDMIGANGYLWRIMHNVVHHTYTNIEGVDEDLDATWALRLSPHAPYRKVHRFQHWYALLPYSLATLNWVFIKDFRFFFRKEIGPYAQKKHPLKEWLLLFGGKAFYLTWAIVLPLLLLDITWWQFAIGFLAMHFTTASVMSVIFQLAHVVEQTAHPQPGPGRVMEHQWVVHELATTANFAMHNRLLSWYVGGLNFQIEHHLFPKICSVHYPAISGIVRETAAKYNIPYHYHRTLFGAVRSHWAMLKKLGRPPVDTGSLAAA